MLRTGFERAVILALVSVLVSTPIVASEHHIVPLSEVRGAAGAASQTRQQNLAAVRGLLSAGPVQRVLDGAKLDRIEAQRALALLSDDELAKLAVRADKVQRDLAGGALSNQELTYIVIALATAVIILVIVAA